MYRKPDGQMFLEEFVLPFEGKLRKDNRWVKLAKIIPWDEIEENYAKLFESNRGEVAKPVRMALGALIIKEKCGYSDRETVEQIRENPYLQYFVGLPRYQEQAPFDPSLMVHFRKRFSPETLIAINEKISLGSKKNEEKKDDDNDILPPSCELKEDTQSKPVAQEKHPQNQGKIILDATCTPADIRYPTDLSLLNEAREKLDNIIDALHQSLGKPGRRPRTYRKVARKAYLTVAKQRKSKYRAIRKAVRKQLHYVARNLRAVNRLQEQAEIADCKDCLSSRQQQELAAIRKLYEQQNYMYTNRSHRMENRIVSISQPHVRPIVRGKAKAEVEFGAKVSISMVNGYAFIEKLAWEAYNEGNTLIESSETYYQRFGCYPEAIQADKIYRTRDNLKYCQKLGIRLSGPRLGRPPAEQEKKKERLRLERQDSSERNAVEGKFGEGKRCYGLGRIMARLKETAESVICLQFLVMNLEHKLRVLLCYFMDLFFLRFQSRDRIFMECFV